MISGITGLVANVLLVLFFVLARPLGEVRAGYMWLGTANDWVIVVQFLTFIPVALALRGWLPATAGGPADHGGGRRRHGGTAVLQLLLVAGVLEFDVQVLLVVAMFLLVYGWVLTVSSAGHRHGTLPRPVTRFGLLLGVCFPVGLLISAAGLPFGWGSVAQLAFGVPGVVLGAVELAGASGVAAAAGPARFFVAEMGRPRAMLTPDPMDEAVRTSSGGDSSPPSPASSANGLLLALYTVAQRNSAYEWTGPANDVIGAVSSGATIPVALALVTVLGETRALRLATRLAVGAMALIVGRTPRSSAGLIPFAVQVPAPASRSWRCSAGSSWWAGPAGHGRLPRRLARAAEIIGAAVLVAHPWSACRCSFRRVRSAVPRRRGGSAARRAGVRRVPGLAAAAVQPAPPAPCPSASSRPELSRCRLEGERKVMRTAYKVLAYLVAAEVVIQAMVMVWGIAGLIKWVDGGGVFDKSVMETQGTPFPEVFGFCCTESTELSWFPGSRWCC